jgi:hypothetical protein
MTPAIPRWKDLQHMMSQMQRGPVPGGRANTSNSTDESEDFSAPPRHEQGPTGIFAEFTAATAAVERADFDLLVAQGVPRNWLWLGPMRFGVAEITASNDTYQPMVGGERAIVVPAIPRNDIDEVLGNVDPGDLIAFLPNDPSKWWCRTGACPFLNPVAIARAEIYRQPLRLHRSPLDWLRAGGDGAVVLDERAHLRLHLGGVGEIICDDLALARWIDRALKARVRLPSIRVRTDVREAA